MASFWLGEITLRQLRVLVEQLPPGSALHRALNEGHQWTNVEALLWAISHRLERLDARMQWMKGKKPKWPRWKQFPWSKDGVRMGDRSGRSSAEALAFLRSQSPKEVTDG